MGTDDDEVGPDLACDSADRLPSGADVESGRAWDRGRNRLSERAEIGLRALAQTRDHFVRRESVAVVRKIVGQSDGLPQNV